MENNKNNLIVMFALVLVILLAGCGNSSDELSAKLN